MPTSRTPRARRRAGGRGVRRRWHAATLPSACALALTLVLPLAAACSAAEADPPDLVADGAACDHCGMLISDLHMAAAHDADGEVRVFDDILCLARDLDARPAPAPRIWVRDFEGGGWLRAEDAVYVRSTRLSTPMGGGVVALADRGSALTLASQTGGHVLSSLPRRTAATERPR